MHFLSISYLNNLRTFHARLVDDEVQVSFVKQYLFDEGFIFDVVAVPEFLEVNYITA